MFTHKLGTMLKITMEWYKKVGSSSAHVTMILRTASNALWSINCRIYLKMNRSVHKLHGLRSVEHKRVPPILGNLH